MEDTREKERDKKEEQKREEVNGKYSSSMTQKQDGD